MNIIVPDVQHQHGLLSVDQRNRLYIEASTGERYYLSESDFEGQRVIESESTSTTTTEVPTEGSDNARNLEVIRNIGYVKRTTRSSGLNAVKRQKYSFGCSSTVTSSGILNQEESTHKPEFSWLPEQGYVKLNIGGEVHKILDNFGLVNPKYSIGEYPTHYTGEFKLEPVYFAINPPTKPWPLPKGFTSEDTLDLTEAIIPTCLWETEEEKAVYFEGLKTDNLYKTKRLPCNKKGINKYYYTLPKWEANKVEVPLTAIHKQLGYCPTAVQDIGHVCFEKATYYCDPELYPTIETEVEIEQVYRRKSTRGKDRADWDEIEEYILLPEYINIARKFWKSKIKYFTGDTKRKVQFVFEDNYWDSFLEKDSESESDIDPFYEFEDEWW